MSYEPIKIGSKVLTLDKVKEEFKETKRKLTAQELSLLLEDAWADVALIAYVLDMSPGRIHGWRKRGKLIAVKKLGRWYFQLDQFRDVFFLETLPGRFSGGKKKRELPRHIQRLRYDFLNEVRAELIEPLPLSYRKGKRKRPEPGP